MKWNPFANTKPRRQPARLGPAPGLRTRRPPRVIAQNRGRTAAADPGERTYIYLPRSSETGVRVTHDNALTFSAVWACVRVISEDMAKMPWHVLNEQKEVASDHAADWVLYREPNPEMSAFTFRETLLAHVLTWGNGYAEIVRTRGSNRIAELWLLSPDRVEPKRNGSGQLFYRIDNGAGQDPTNLWPEDVLHVHGLGWAGLQGYSVVGMHRRTFGLGLSMQESGASLFGNSSIPAGIVKYNTPITAQVAKDTREEWNKLYAGPANRGRVAVLGGDADFKPITMSSQDAEYIASRQFTVEDVCRIYRVPPHKVQHLLRSTFSNIEQQAIEYVVDTLMPWAARLEQEADRKLLGRNQRGRLYTKINLASLMRGDSAARSAYYWQMVQMGVHSPNDVRELEDMPAIGPDGDKRFIPANLISLEKAGEEVPVPAAPQAPQETETDDDTPPAIAERMNGNGATNGKH
jgi:HK97 family phage portal protein